MSKDVTLTRGAFSSVVNTWPQLAAALILRKFAQPEERISKAMLTRNAGEGAGGST